MTLFAGLDAGTGGARCLIVDEAGRRVGYGERDWRYGGEGPALVELDPGDALAAIAGAAGDALAACDPAEITALGVTSQRTGVAFLDADGREISIGPNADGRGMTAGLELERAHGPAIYRIAGRLPAMLYLPARLAWFRANRPDVVIARALSIGDWVVWRLTGRASTDPTQAAEMLVYDVAGGSWSEQLLEQLEVPPGILPQIGAPGEPAGEIADTRFGFVPGTPVIAAGADTQCASLGLGLVQPGAAAIVAGTTVLAEHLRADASIDPEGGLWTSPHAVPGVFVQEAHCGEAGAAIAWVASIMGMAPAELATLATGGRPGAGGVVFTDTYPSSASDFPLLRRGSLSFPAPVLALGRPRADVARAVIEGVAFGAREGLARLAMRNGDPLSLALAGGCARSEVFVAALAGSAEREVRVATEPASSALGAAIAAAAGHHGGIEAAAGVMHDRGRQVAPSGSDGYPAHHAAWRERAATMDAESMKMGGLL